jgi:hypothetical protein
MFLTLDVDCIRSVLGFLRAEDLLVVGQVCTVLNGLSNEPSLWLDLLQRRIGRHIATNDPRGMYRRSLRAGYPRMLSCFGDQEPLHIELATRNDIVRMASSFSSVACITLEDECIVGQLAEPSLCRYIGRADDVRIEKSYGGGVTLATLYRHVVTVYRLDRNLAKVSSVVVDHGQIRSLIGIYNRVVLLSTFTDTVVSVIDDSVRTMATDVHNACLVDGHPPRLAWSRDVDKYFCVFGHNRYFLLGTTLYIHRTCLESSDMVEEIEPPPSVLTGESLQLTTYPSPGYTSETLRWYRCTIPVVDAWYDGDGVMVLSTDRKLYSLYNGKATEAKATNVLWARNDTSGNTNYIIGR